MRRGWRPSLPKSISISIRMQEYSEYSMVSDVAVGERTADATYNRSNNEEGRSKDCDVLGFETTFEIRCERNETVLVLKDRIAESTGFASESQRLLHIGRFVDQKI